MDHKRTWNADHHETDGPLTKECGSESPVAPSSRGTSGPHGVVVGGMVSQRTGRESGVHGEFNPQTYCPRLNLHKDWEQNQEKTEGETTEGAYIDPLHSTGKLAPYLNIAKEGYEAHVCKGPSRKEKITRKARVIR